MKFRLQNCKFLAQDRCGRVYGYAIKPTANQDSGQWEAGQFIPYDELPFHIVAGNMNLRWDTTLIDVSINDYDYNEKTGHLIIGPAFAIEAAPEGENSGGSVDYYKISVENPTTFEKPYRAECNDIIEALNMNFAEGEAFKAIWRNAASRIGLQKAGSTPKREADKIVFYANRIAAMSRNRE